MGEGHYEKLKPLKDSPALLFPDVRAVDFRLEKK
jgi:hypothetical protein